MNSLLKALVSIILLVILSWSVFSQSVVDKIRIPGWWWYRDTWYEATESDMAIVDRLQDLFESYHQRWEFSYEEIKVIYELLGKAQSEFPNWSRKHRIASSLLNSRIFHGWFLMKYNLPPWSTYHLKYTLYWPSWDVVVQDKEEVLIIWTINDPYMFHWAMDEVIAWVSGMKAWQIKEISIPRLDGVTEEGYREEPIDWHWGIPSDYVWEYVPVEGWPWYPSYGWYWVWVVIKVTGDTVLVDYPIVFGKDHTYVIEVLKVE